MSNILKDVSQIYSGQYFEEPEKRMYSPDGAFIVQNSKTIIQYNNVVIRIYLYANKGIRSYFDYQGSPYRITCELIAGNDSIEIFPKSNFIKLISGKNKSHEFFKIYQLKTSKTIKKRISKNHSLLDLMSKRKFSLFTKNQENSKLIVLIPMDSVISVKQLIELIEIIKKLVPTIAIGNAGFAD